MGKGARLREQRKMEKENKEIEEGCTIETVDMARGLGEEKVDKDSKPELLLRPMDGFFLKKNLAAMEMLGWDKNGLIDAIKNTKDIQVKIDPSIVLQGVKNPLTTVYVGFSTRKLYDAMVRKKKIVKFCLIVEPELGVFKHLISTEDISDLLLNKDIEFILGVKGEPCLTHVFRALTKPIDGTAISRSTLAESMEIIVDPFFYVTEEQQKVGNFYGDVVKDAVHQLKLSMGCSDDQYRRWEMMLENKKYMYNSYKIDGLFDKFKDIPVIVLGGGPSLDDFIKNYKENPKLKNALIITADAVLKKLLDNGIKPHLVTRCERKLTSIFQGVTKEMTKGIYYCAYPWTPKEFFDLFEDTIYLFRQNGVCLFTELSHGSIDGGVSAGNAAFEMAIRLGAKNIIMSGIDLCFIGGKSHVEGTQVEFNINKSKAKWTDIETNNGNKSQTIPVWERCRNEYMQSIEKWQRKGKTFTVYNTSLEGAVIPLTQVKKWDELKSLFVHDLDVSEMLGKNLTRLPQSEIDNFEKKIADTIPKFKTMLQQATVAIGLAEDAKRTADREITKLVKHVNGTVEYDYDKIRAFRNNVANYDKLWSSVADAYETNFKQKLYLDPLFRLVIFDVLQLDLYHCENAINSLFNRVETPDERNFAFYQIMKEFAIKVEHYLAEFVKMFEASK